MAEEWMQNRLLRVAAPDDSERLLKVLRAIPGVAAAEWQEHGLLALRYDLHMVDLSTLVHEMQTADAIVRTYRWRLRWFAYAEAIQRQTAGNDLGWEANIRHVHVSRQRSNRHGQRDERAQHWRKYLDKPGSGQ